MKRFFLLIVITFLICFASSKSVDAQQKKHVIQYTPKYEYTSKQEEHRQIAEAKIEKPLPKSAEEFLNKNHVFDKFYNNYIIQNNLVLKNTMIVKPKELADLDSFINGCITKGVFPGCQVFASKNGQIIYKKNFGDFVYNEDNPVTDSTLYDIASVTKILATNLAVMKLVEEGKIDLNAPLSKYLDFLTGTDKAGLIIKDLLLHQAGLVAWIPFYKNTLDSITGRPSAAIYRSVAETNFNTPVADHLFIRNNYRETIWEEILNSPLSNKGRYVYSDLDFYFLKEVVESVSGMPIDQYLNKNFYYPLQLNHTMFNPWKKHLIKDCAPTEVDDYFRFQKIQGFVHDPGAAMMGGIEGHAGLFSNVSDISVLMQMLNNGGVYNGKRYFKPETLALFTAYNSSLSRRGLGFDKPDKDLKDGGPASVLCDKSTFGHQGFTGTCAWSDPETGIVFIFLSNRVYPTANNRLINSLDVRTNAQTYIYKALGYGK